MQLLVFILAYPFLWIISILPHRLFYGFSDFVFFLVYRVIGYRRTVVQENLKLVFPTKNSKEIYSIEKKFYRHMCDMFLEMVKSMNLTKDQIKRKFKVLNIEVINELEKRRSILVVCSHYANWEWDVSMNNYIEAKGYAVYQKIGNKYFDRFIKRVREKWNTTLITQQQTVKTVIRNQRDGVTGVIGMVSDQSPQAHKAQYWSEFMGVKVPVFNGAETMAGKLGLAVVFLKVSKVKRGHYQAEFIPITENGKNTVENEITETFLRLTEQQIKERPEHYL
ncbi:lysophospholipid acyltransferase family protein [Maribacter litopenaei]|uniref:Lysophospholipid acyltransferase family protein n=2 Tax=Maribacter litopenaei TaxID=2976127 RepID=A0ABY5YBZ0_9FLAO|nr:lysophospholipid acyltransferase family protein [Maribacter litopenaei]UWX56587.1 lysophospholipid acyltransferase family protein [Maribacter litopenaei]